MRIGIFFGGPSREREISFAGGRTVYDNLDKRLFEAIPIFVDSYGSLILLDWQYVYKGTIRDFFPSSDITKEDDYSHYVESYFDGQGQEYLDELAKIGQVITWTDLRTHIDFGFLALHGQYGEDGVIQSLCTQHHIPYSGSDIVASAIGINKAIQKKLMKAGGFEMPAMIEIRQKEWLKHPTQVMDRIGQSLGNHFVIRPAHQGSSIGVSILKNAEQPEITEAIDQAFFIKKWTGKRWSEAPQETWLKSLADVKENLGLPVRAQDDWLTTTQEVRRFLAGLGAEEEVTLQARDGEAIVIVEEFIEGREFSCITIRDVENDVHALPPTEIVKQGQLYDYRSKYLPGFSRKVTPIDLPGDDVRKIMSECQRLFDFLEFKCYARIDGFFTPDGRIILNDPNTTSGMLPSSFFFHQAAEIGLNPSEFLSFVIHSSLHERAQGQGNFRKAGFWKNWITDRLLKLKDQTTSHERIAIIFGGYSFERHISVESGRNIYEKLASSSKYQPTPLFLMQGKNDLELYELPISLLLKDNADDIRSAILHFKQHPIKEEIKSSCASITQLYAQNHAMHPVQVDWSQLSNDFDSVFIALHGRPGEDGAVQARLDEIGLAYNGSSSAVSSLTINKFNTLQFLKKQGFTVAAQMVVPRSKYVLKPTTWLEEVERSFSYPLIAKPVDDGCSSAVMIIRDRAALMHYFNGVFRDGKILSEDLRNALGLEWNEEFPQKEDVLIEELIRPEGAELFMEITCGVHSIWQDGKERIHVMEPSEAIASEDILSLEEKFLAGQGLNITPARLSTGQWDYHHITKKVKADLKRASELVGISGYARIDAFVRVFADGSVDTIIIEFNSLPGMTPATCIYHQAALEGLKPYEFIDKIMTFAQEKNEMAYGDSA